ncbi:MAG: Uma2 family endonuclease [Chloroflexaceae bacterium]|nr:Uma2 family endonuclease [Chloroflexaceae bacterium]NJL32721.1 Uma2 family endonuclease [Chloroflexaceae bacterium]NJO04170.1 Uma2 family endonuclease [Chloroflexaceae bacterium]
MATSMIEHVQTVVLPANLSDINGPRQGKWTFNDFASLPANPNAEKQQRYEIIDGVLYAAPLPNETHQKVVGWIYYYLTSHVRLANRGKVFVAPFDVEIGADAVVQPDVLVVLNDNLGCIVTPNRVIGAPDLVVEVSTPDTTGYDRREKQDVYARAGVREYWVVDAAAETVEVMVLRGGTFRPVKVCYGKSLIPSKVVQGMPVIAEQFFADKR